jgi:hypothetical protein
MNEQQELTFSLPGEVSLADTVSVEPSTPAVEEEPHAEPVSPQLDGAPTPVAEEGSNGSAAVTESRQARAGREGARRVHQLIQEGRLYEQEHGLKRGRQRLRQLIELGKLYEQEHGLRPARMKKRGRLSRLRREELLETLLQCLIRLARPSFRAELERLIEALPQQENGNAA